MLVISRLSIVRMTSAASRMASVVSLKNAVQSTTTRSWVGAERLEHLLDAARRDHLGHLRGRRREQHPDAGGVVDHEGVDRLDSPALELGDEVGDRLALGVQVEQDAHVAELEGAVHEDDLLAELGRGGDREVDRDGGAADAALGAEDRDDLAGLAAGSPDRCRVGCAPAWRRRDPARLVALASADLADRGGQLVAAERLDQELARAGEHRAAQVVGLALDGHHHDRCVGHAATELLGRGDAVHVRHVDVHQHDIRA